MILRTLPCIGLILIGVFCQCGINSKLPSEKDFIDENVTLAGGKYRTTTIADLFYEMALRDYEACTGSACAPVRERLDYHKDQVNDYEKDVLDLAGFRVPPVFPMRSAWDAQHLKFFINDNTQRQLVSVTVQAPNGDVFATSTAEQLVQSKNGQYTLARLQTVKPLPQRGEVDLVIVSVPVQDREARTDTIRLRVAN